MDKKNAEFDLMFETSWEVCNKIGGIYTVLSTKARTLQQLYRDRVVFIGPDVWTEEHPSPVFLDEPSSALRRWAKESRFPEGVSVRVGRWDVPGKPLAVLVKFDGMYAVKNEFYSLMWQLYGVDSLHAYGDYDEACAFSHAAALVIESIIGHRAKSSERYIAHFDEWTTGMGLLYVKHRLPRVATIFTTHATSIGRSICGNGKALYAYMPGYDGDQMARELNMESKHSLEKAAALNADCFTTVSDVTARECEQLLGRHPDVVTPNGFEAGFVPSKTKMPAARKAARERILNVASALTGHAFAEDTFIVATSGRCEFRNKGIDLFLDSMTRLGDSDPRHPILALVLVPAWVQAPRADLTHALKLKRRHRLDDPVTTHTVHNPNDDVILRRIHEIGFTNDSQARVNVIYTPCYLDGHDGIFNLHYYEMLPGLDATVFPSYYEPWGYTPLESVAFGVPTVTTGLSGFGQWVARHYANTFAADGAVAVERGDFDYERCRDLISDSIRSLVDIAGTSASEEVSAAARATAAAAAWSKFIEDYRRAFRIAIDNNIASNQ